MPEWWESDPVSKKADQSKDWWAADSPVQKKAPQQEPGFGSRLYDQTVGGLVKLGEEVVNRSKKQDPRAALGGVVRDTAQGLWDAYKRQPGTNPFARALGAVTEPMVDVAEQDIRSGNLPALAGDVAAAGMNLYGPRMLGAAANSIPGARQAVGRRLMQSALKPGVADAKTLGDVRAVTQTALDEGIVASEAGLGNLEAKAADQLQGISDIVDDYANRGHAISRPAAASRLGDVERRFGAQVAPASDIRDIGKIRDEFLTNNLGSSMAFDEAQAIKQGTYQQVQGKYGALSEASIEAQKAIARGIKEEMELIAPELAGENAKLGAMVDLQKVLERTVRRQGNSDFIDLGDAAVAAGSAVAGGAPAGIAAGVWRKTIGNPAIKSRLAIALYQGSKASGKPLSYAAATARAGTIINALMERSQENQQQ